MQLQDELGSLVRMGGTHGFLRLGSNALVSGDMSDQMNSNQPPANQDFGAQPQHPGANAQGGYAPQAHPAQQHPYPAQQQHAAAGYPTNAAGQANPYGDGAADQGKTLDQHLRSIGLGLLGFGLLLGFWNFMNSMSVMSDLGFFNAYFFVQKPIHMFQAYGSVVGVVGGIILLIASAAVKKK